MNPIMFGIQQIDLEIPRDNKKCPKKSKRNEMETRKRFY